IFEGRNDLTINGQKFSGNAQCVFENRILHHGTLLFSSKMTDLSAALNVHPLKFQDKAVKSIRKRVTNISEHLQQPLTITDFSELIMQHIQAHYPNCHTYQLSANDDNQIQDLVNRKYNTWQWNFGTSPQYDYSKTIRTNGGNIEVNLHIQNGIIQKTKIFGDFFTRQDIENFEQLFVNQPYQEEVITRLLADVNIDDYFLNIGNEDIINAMF
ncbi:MAG: lipoate protein ligase C-terminal domain-containing protein, partial [Bacteroidales bacterium]|nr:lipoate protein ligase C-terminal domain-containing protein [Bacteroidales bacterium]